MPGILEILTPSRMPHPPGAATSGTSLPSPRRFGSKVFFRSTPAVWYRTAPHGKSDSHPAKPNTQTPPIQEQQAAAIPLVKEALAPMHALCSESSSALLDAPHTMFMDRARPLDIQKHMFNIDISTHAALSHCNLKAYSTPI